MKVEIELSIQDVEKLSLVALNAPEQMNWSTLVLVMMRWGLRDYERINEDLLASAPTLQNAIAFLASESDEAR